MSSSQIYIGNMVIQIYFGVYLISLILVANFSVNLKPETICLKRCYKNLMR